MEAKTALGSYLLTKRLSREGENVAKYLDRYSVSDVVSESYYRDIEVGRKTPRIQSADEICNVLNLDRRSFYYYLLKDLLPSDVFEQIVSASLVDSYRSASDKTRQLESSNRDLAEAIVNISSDDVTDLSEDNLLKLENDAALLAVLHFAYNRNEVSTEEVDLVYRQCGGKGPVGSRLARILPNVFYEKEGQNVVVRKSRTIQVPNTPIGRGFKDRFTLMEMEKSLKAVRRNDIFEKSGTIQHSMIVPLGKEDVAKLTFDGVARCLSALGSADQSLDSGDAKPFFVNITISTRSEYDLPDAARKKET